MHTRLNATFIIWLSRLGLTALLLALLTSLTVGAASAKPAAPWVIVTPHGTYVHLAISSAQPVALTVAITAQPKVAGKPSPPVIASASTGAAKKANWGPDLTGLSPKTTYWYTVFASDPSGTTTFTDSFTTLRRQVTVAYTTIYIDDDSDALGNGELTFFFGMDDRFSHTPYAASAGTGSTLYPFWTKTLPDAPDMLRLMVQGQEDDCDFHDVGSCAGPTIKAGLDGCDEQGEWITPYDLVNTAVSGPKESFVKQFTLEARQPGGCSLEFTVKGWYRVDYVK